MDIVDFLFKTLFEALAWIIKLLCSAVVGLVSLIIKGIASLFNKSEA